ncbi:hypothetical protein BLNAU_16182 [Blattamonas nauphoetae]|uniref:Uncharacterized protein n=1 Tax=Blattamonas nauphoetae TaxID=2049346 RepID=A0ABQ9XBS8_9EUKA|nr:hypothetical protein BLNAU_16182 [Blattamonas nauphoetae]
MTGLDTKQSSSTDSLSSNCLPFLKWSYSWKESESEKAVIFLSIVATVNIQSALDVSLEAKAVKFLESVKFGQPCDESSTVFVQSIMVLISSANHVISTAATKILDLLIWKCSTKVRYALVKADLIPQIITILNPLSLSFEEVKSTHNNIMTRIRSCLLLATPNGLASLEITDDDGLQAVHETILEQIVVPSEKYICHLCVNRFSIVDRDLTVCKLFVDSDVTSLFGLPERLGFSRHPSIAHTLLLLRRLRRSAPKWKTMR